MSSVPVDPQTRSILSLQFYACQNTEAYVGTRVTSSSGEHRNVGMEFSVDALNGTRIHLEYVPPNGNTGNMLVVTQDGTQVTNVDIPPDTTQMHWVVQLARGVSCTINDSSAIDSSVYEVANTIMETLSASPNTGHNWMMENLEKEIQEDNEMWLRDIRKR